MPRFGWRKAARALALAGWLALAIAPAPGALAGISFGFGDDEDRERAGDAAAVSIGVGLLTDLMRKHHPFVDHEAIFQVAASETEAQIAALEKRHHLTHVDAFTSTLTDTTLVLVRRRDRDSEALVKDLLADPEVQAAQPNYLYAVAAGGGPSAAPSAQYAAAVLQLPEAHALATGAGVTVAIVDTAVDETHPELKGAVADRFDAIGGSVSTRVHGTSIAGLIAAHASLMGAAPAVRLQTARALDTNSGESMNVLKAFHWAATHGARVVNMSITGPRDEALIAQLDVAVARGVVVVAAAGNNGPTSPPLYPAAAPAVIAVAATDAQGRLYQYDNVGAYITVAAPGVDVLVAEPGGKYNNHVSGTSEAAAEVTGVVALMLQRHPRLTPDEVRAALLASGDPIPATHGGFAPHLVNALRAVQAAAP
jgi:subtilisin family serine protease